MHPRPMRAPQPPPSTSPPPPEFEEQYQRFSSPPVHSSQQQHFGGGMSHSTSYGQGLPDAYIPAGHQGGHGGYAAPQHHQQQQQQHPQQQQHQSFGAPWLSAGGDGGQGWPGMNDATTAMGVQFGTQALSAGTAYIDKNFTRLLPLAHLKHSFNVSNGYVLNKLRLVLWPWRHRPWARGVRRSEQSGVVEGWKPPREDINCPDLYIPVMALTTYILLSALHAGKAGTFDPRILGQTASKAFGLLFLEFLCIKLGCYLLGIGEEGAVVDLIAYEGYKFVGVIVTLIAGLMGAKGWLFWLVFLYTVFANFFFQLRSLRHIVLPDPALSPLDHATPATSSTSTGAHSHAQRSKRIQFLFVVALAQGASMAVLIRV